MGWGGYSTTKERVRLAVYTSTWNSSLHIYSNHPLAPYASGGSPKNIQAVKEHEARSSEGNFSKIDIISKFSYSTFFTHASIIICFIIFVRFHCMYLGDSFLGFYCYMDDLYVYPFVVLSQESPSVSGWDLNHPPPPPPGLALRQASALTT